MDQALGRIMMDSSDRKALGWLDAAGRESREWREAVVLSNSTIFGSPEELRQIKEDQMAVLRPCFRTERPVEDARVGARLLHAALRVVPGTG
jgi:hypothetical protein